MYGLPYDLGHEAEMRDTVTKYFEHSIGKIKTIKFFDFRQYLDVTPNERKIPIQENLDLVFDPLGAKAGILGQEWKDLYGNLDKSETFNEKNTPSKQIYQKLA